MFEALVFDLDDTLLDTYHLLIPKAVEKAGLKFQQITGLTVMSIAEFSASWEVLHTQFSGRELYQKISEQLLEKYKFNLPKDLESERLYNAVYASFLQPNLPEAMALPTTTLEMLTRLQQHHKLYLVTQGLPTPQEEKIKKLNITHFFKQIFIVNSTMGESKTEAFKKILNIEACAAEKILSVGNRLSHEISMAKKLGMKTCHIAIGEHKAEIPHNDYEIADWTIYSLAEFESKCQL